MTLRISGYWLHWCALVCEGLGSLLVFLEAHRISVELATGVAHADFAGQPPPGYQAWWYDSGGLGFALLLAGIMLTGIALFVDHHCES